MWNKQCNVSELTSQWSLTASNHFSNKTRRVSPESQRVRQQLKLSMSAESGFVLILVGSSNLTWTFVWLPAVSRIKSLGSSCCSRFGVMLTWFGLLLEFGDIDRSRSEMWFVCCTDPAVCPIGLCDISAAPSRWLEWQVNSLQDFVTIYHWNLVSAVAYV